jgi:hypothetical protein
MELKFALLKAARAETGISVKIENKLSSFSRALRLYATSQYYQV